MKGILFITTFGLLIAEALGALFLSIIASQASIGIIAALLLLLAALSYALRQLKHCRLPAMPAAIGFSFGFLFLIYASFHTASLWLVILLSLNAAGFILSLDELTTPRKRRQDSFDRKAYLAKQLPPKPAVKVEVYEDKQKKKKAAKKKTTKKATKKKKTAKKKTATQPETTKKKRGRPKKNA